MLKTLLRYLMREMGKTFLLTSVGLTLMLSLGGGVRNLLKGEGLGTMEVIQVLSFVVPGAFTLSLPVAGLFSAAMTYGRFAADNELNACRAGGINVHKLLAPVVGLSLVIAAVTFWFSNFVIPGYIKDLNEIVGKNAFRIVMNALTTKGAFEFRGNIIHVDRMVNLDTGEQDADGDVRTFAAFGGAFMEMSGDRPKRVASTEAMVAEFESIGEKPRVRAILSNVRGFDLEKNQFYEAAEQPFGPYDIPPVGIDLKPKWMTLGELRRYREHPEAVPRIQEALTHLRAQLRRYLFYVWVGERLQGPDHAFTLGQPGYPWLEVRAEKYAADLDTARPRLKDPHIVEHGDDRTRTITAELGVVSANLTRGQDVPLATITLDGNVVIVDSTDPDKPIRKASLELPMVYIPREVMDQEASYTDAVLLDENKDLGLGKRIESARAGLIADMRRQVLRIDSVLHSRTAFCVSVLVTMMLGACLGIVLRGGHIMTAFGVSFAPALFVIATIAMGRQIALHPHTALAGTLIIWASILLVGALDVLVLYKGVRR
ncbi:MAG: LptF/LptG family permease [Phycisphaerales bacterium]|nr:MAG: LptF/LptG family permease [Phycisphaerales bacterium]